MITPCDFLYTIWTESFVSLDFESVRRNCIAFAFLSFQEAYVSDMFVEPNDVAVIVVLDGLFI